MELIKKIEGASAIIYKGGTYQVASVYEMGGQVVAKRGSGYIGLYSNGNTTVKGVLLKKLVWDNSTPLGHNTFGLLGITTMDSSFTPMPEKDFKRLMGGAKA